MKTNFKEYLEKKNAQKVIDDAAEKYKDKKIILYGADLFAGDLFRNYNLSKLNILGVADKSFEDNYETDYYGYKKIGLLDLLETNFDILLIIAYDDTGIKQYLKKELLQGEEINFKIKSLITLNLFEYIKDLINGEI